MEIKKKIVVPTGEIYTAIGEKGMLEFLTVGDYGVYPLGAVMVTKDDYEEIMGEDAK